MKIHKLSIKLTTLMILSVLTFNAIANKSKDFVISIEIRSDSQKAWNVITNFQQYPTWTTLLEMKGNDGLTINEKFSVTIKDPKKKPAKFKAKLLSVGDCSFSARQIILGKWMFAATHHFVIEEIDQDNIRFTQRWELNGIISSLFRKKIHKVLSEFNQMNTELKVFLESGDELTKG